MSCGISFIVRIRNEESTLEGSVRSLFNVTIPHEINLILHCCTDRSLEIATKLASENNHIKLYTYDFPISRAGYENLATDAISDHSFVKYSNFCFNTGSFIWKFKWDADFIASPALLDFLNSKEWVKENILYVITYKNETMKSAEVYLSDSILSYIKYMFWEVICYSNKAVKKSLGDDIFIYHASELSKLKSYWEETPWFIQQDSNEARLVKQRVEQLKIDFGDEPEGMARALNPICDVYQRKILKAKPSYVNFNS